jgi:hypothetical protein
MAVRPRIGNFHKVGSECPGKLIPPEPERTIMLDAGALRFGIEQRVVPDVEESTYKGPSVHVLGADDGHEYLRFDVFDGLPHYHYIDPFAEPSDEQGVPGISNVIVAFDFAAHGPMWPWLVEVLRNRLPDMLRHAELDALADKVDNAEIAKALPAIVELCEVTAPTEHWLRTAPPRAD